MNELYKFILIIIGLTLHGCDKKESKGKENPVEQEKAVLESEEIDWPIVSINWTEITSKDAPTPRGYHSAAWTGQDMLIWGGGPSSDMPKNALLKSGSIYSPLTNTWKPMSETNAPLPRYRHNTGWLVDRMLIYGGVADPYVMINPDLNFYLPEFDQWKSAKLPSYSTQFPFFTCHVWTGTELIIWGGSDFFQRDGLNKDPLFSHRYNPKTDSWVKIAPIPGGFTRDSASCVWTGEEMIVWGGKTIRVLGEDPVYLNSGAAYNPKTNQWREITLKGAPEERSGHKAVWIDKYMMIIDGSNRNPGDRWQKAAEGAALYDPSADSWISIPSVPHKFLLEINTLVVGKKLLIWPRAAAHYVEDGIAPLPAKWLFIFDTAEKVWKKSENKLANREGITAISTGEKIIFFGGFSMSRKKNASDQYELVYTPMNDGGILTF